MARRIATGRTGRALLGSLTTEDNRLQSLQTNTNLLLDPNGTGISVSTKDFQVNGANTLRLAASNSTNFVGLRAPGTVASNITYTLPGSGVVADRFLRTDASGNLSWELAAVSVTNQTADAATYYPTITTATSGTLTAVSTSSSRLTFQPSTGTLTATIVNATTSMTSATGTFTTLNGSASASGFLTIQGTSSGTKTTASIRMTENIASTTTGTGTLVVSGGVGIAGQLTASTIVETSSIAFKENIVPIESALDKIMRLTGVIYDRKDGSSLNEPGLIAEWVNEVMPELVTKDADGNVYGLQYTKLTAYFVEAIKSLKTEIDTLKRKD